jgi:hypothetical protein
MTPDSRIAIVGAGAAGLSVAWFLKKSGYRHVTVFERSDRIGGKCKSLTFAGRSFDLGANYITSSYTQVRRLARTFGMGMFTERKGHALDPRSGELSSLLSATTRQYGLVHVAWASLRYLYLRFRLRHVLAPAAPGFLAASADPDLCGPFEIWLEKHGLAALEPVFNIPVTLMGYDKLKQIPAAYALTYMNPRTFLDLMMFAVDPPLRAWPKRFHLGYERLWERVAAEVDVRRGADIKSIERDDRVTIHYELEATKLTGTELDAHVDAFDALILACPLLPDVLHPFLRLTPQESELFAKVGLDPFVVTTYPTSCSTPVHAVSFMFPRPQIGEPYVVTQQFSDVPLLSIYSRIDAAQKVTRAQVLANNRRLLTVIGAENPEVELCTYDEFPYFPHVGCEAMGDGFYRALESLQGVNRTYYVGGLLGFELVETIVEYSRHLVDTHFGGDA